MSNKLQKLFWQRKGKEYLKKKNSLHKNLVPSFIHTQRKLLTLILLSIRIFM